jgi:light-regulated signal transduction histidine kinase (bacteriophytochrome)
MSSPPRPRVPDGWGLNGHAPLMIEDDKGDFGLVSAFPGVPVVAFTGRDDDVRDNGIGLALCRKIVESRRGLIGVRSHGKGLGRTFHFTLPDIAGGGAR